MQPGRRSPGPFPVSLSVCLMLLMAILTYPVPTEKQRGISNQRGLITSGALLLLALSSVWWFVSSKQAIEREAAHSSQSEFKEIEELSAEVAQLKRETASQIRRVPGVSAGSDEARPSRFADTAALAADLETLRRIGVNFSLAPIENLDMATLVSGLASILGLSPNEAAAFRQVAEARAEELIRAMLASTSIRQAPGVVMIETRRPANATEIMERMEESFREIAGDKRYAIYQNFGVQGAIESAFTKAGLGPIKFTVTKTTDSTGQQQYQVVRQEGVSVTGRNVDASREGLRNVIGVLEALVPTNF